MGDNQLFLESNPEIATLVESIIIALGAIADVFENTVRQLRNHIRANICSHCCKSSCTTLLIDVAARLKSPLEVLDLKQHVIINFRSGNTAAEMILLPLTVLIESIKQALESLHEFEVNCCSTKDSLTFCLNHYVDFISNVKYLERRIHQSLEAGVDDTFRLETRQECDKLFDKFAFAKLNGAFIKGQYLVPQKLLRNALSIDPKTFIIFKGADQDHTNLVRPIDNVFFKTIEHGYPSIEVAVYLLSKLIFGGGITPSTFLIFDNVPKVDNVNEMICRIAGAFPNLAANCHDLLGENSSNREKALDNPDFYHTFMQLVPATTFFVNASLMVSGVNFLGHFSNPLGCPVTMSSLSSMYMLSLLTSPNDAKQDNFVIDAEENVVGVDNDMSFYKDWKSIQDHKLHAPRVSSIFFCMQNLANSPTDPIVRQCLQRNVGSIIIAWKTLHNCVVHEYQQLAQDVTILSLSTEAREKFEDLCLGEISPVVLNIVAKRLHTISRCLHDASTTHDQIFKAIYPGLHALYKSKVCSDAVQMLAIVKESSIDVDVTPCVPDQCTGDKGSGEPFYWDHPTKLPFPALTKVSLNEGELRELLGYLVETNDIARGSCKSSVHIDYIAKQYDMQVNVPVRVFLYPAQPRALAHLLFENLQIMKSQHCETFDDTTGYLLDYIVRENLFCALHACVSAGFKCVKQSAAIIRFFQEHDHQFHCELCASSFFLLESANLKIAWEVALALICPVVSTVDNRASATFSCATLNFPLTVADVDDCLLPNIENRYFHPDIANQLKTVLLQPADRAIAVVTKGYHGVFVKMLPDYPLTELSVRCLSTLLHGPEIVDEIYPQVLLCSFHGLPMLLSHARGHFFNKRLSVTAPAALEVLPVDKQKLSHSLSTVLAQDGTAIMQKLDSKTFPSLVIDTVIFDCKDGHGNNYVVETLESAMLRVVSVDNDQCLFPPELFSKSTDVPINSTIFKLLSPHPLDDDQLKAKWSVMDPRNVVLQWLKSLKVINRYAHELFPTFQRFENKPRQLSFNLGKIKDFAVSNTPSTPSFVDRFRALKQRLTGTPDSVPFSEIMLLLSDSLIMNVYHRLYRVKQILQDSIDVNLSRLLLLMEPQVDLRATAELLDRGVTKSSLALGRSSLHFQLMSSDERRRDVDKTLDEYIKFVASNDASNAVNKVEDLKIFLKDNKKSTLSLEKQGNPLILELLSSSRSHLTVLCLANTGIDDPLLLKVFQQCRHLAALDVSQCHQIETLKIQKGLTKLTSLYARDCQKLTTLSLVCPSLQILVLSGCSQLRIVSETDSLSRPIASSAPNTPMRTTTPDTLSLHSTHSSHTKREVESTFSAETDRRTDMSDDCNDLKSLCDLPNLLELDVSRCPLNDESIDLLISPTLNYVKAHQCGYFAEMRGKYPKVKFSLWPASSAASDIEAFFQGVGKSRNFTNPYLEIERLYASLTAAPGAAPLELFEWEGNRKTLPTQQWLRLQTGLSMTRVTRIYLNQVFLQTKQMEELSLLLRQRQANAGAITELVIRNTSSGSAFVKNYLSPMPDAFRGGELLLPALTLLDLTSCRLKPADAEHFRHLQLHSLRCLILQGNAMGDSICHVLQNLLEWSNTKLLHPIHLNLADTHISHVGLTALWCLVTMHRLKSLNISDNRNMTFVAKALNSHTAPPNVSKESSLETLQLSYIKIASTEEEENEFLQWLKSKPPALRYLKKLDLSKNAIRDKFAKKLIQTASNLSLLPHLCVLDLSYTSVSSYFPFNEYSLRKPQEPPLQIVCEMDSLTLHRLALNFSSSQPTVTVSGSENI